MNHDEQWIDKKLRRFSVVKLCPKCKQPALSYGRNSIHCTNCGYEEDFPSVR
ncbi:hypothetical protein HYY70_04455 [Candidatus Woesearchaeota archaeon]|nr:hypothetical protein [Candidatus Woesearchaeota archaeon]